MYFLKGPRQFEKFFDENVARVRGILYPILGEVDLDDATQEVFLKVWNSIGTFHSRSKLETWVYRISVNTGIDYLRKRKSFATLDEFSHAKEEAHISFVSNQDLIQKALQRIQEESIKLIILYYFEEKTLKEIACILQKPLGTIKAQLSLARKQLEESIKNLGGHYE